MTEAFPYAVRRVRESDCVRFLIGCHRIQYQLSVSILHHLCYLTYIKIRPGYPLCVIRSEEHARQMHSLRAVTDGCERVSWKAAQRTDNVVEELVGRVPSLQTVGDCPGALAIDKWPMVSQELPVCLHIFEVELKVLCILRQRAPFDLLLLQYCVRRERLRFPRDHTDVQRGQREFVIHAAVSNCCSELLHVFAGLAKERHNLKEVLNIT